MISPEALRRYPYFTAGGEQALKALAMAADENSVPAGETLFEEGDRADRLYIIVEGEVDIQLTLQDGGKVTVETMVAGDLIGWSAVSGAVQRRATCVAVKPCKLLSIDGATIRDLCEDNAELGYRMMREVVRALAQRLDGALVQVAAAGPD